MIFIFFFYSLFFITFSLFPKSPLRFFPFFQVSTPFSHIKIISRTDQKEEKEEEEKKEEGRKEQEDGNRD